jgi:hypothetical protein
MLERVVVTRDHLSITIAATADGDSAPQQIKIAWSLKAKDTATLVGNGGPESAHNESLIQSIVRAHGWIRCLRDGAHESIEQLAMASRLHPKVVRQAIRLAFLSPDLTSAILEGNQSKTAFVGANPEVASVVVGRASSSARLISSIHCYGLLSMSAVAP